VPIQRKMTLMGGGVPGLEWVRFEGGEKIV